MSRRSVSLHVMEGELKRRSWTGWPSVAAKLGAARDDAVRIETLERFDLFEAMTRTWRVTVFM